MVKNRKLGQKLKFWSKNKIFGQKIQNLFVINPRSKRSRVQILILIFLLISGSVPYLYRILLLPTFYFRFKYKYFIILMRVHTYCINCLLPQKQKNQKFTIKKKVQKIKKKSCKKIITFPFKNYQKHRSFVSEIFY